MPKPSRRSRTLRRVFKKTATATVLTYKRRRPGKAICGMCKKPLAGVLRDIVCKMQNTPKTCKRPERPYGGVLCSSCSRKVIARKAKEILKNG